MLFQKRLASLVSVTLVALLAILLFVPAGKALASAGGSGTVRVMVGWGVGTTTATSLRAVPEGARVATILRPIHVTVYEVPAASAQQFLDTMRNKPGVRYAELDGDVSGVEFIPNDPEFSVRQYGPQHMNATQAWDLETGDPQVILAIIDSGLDLSHPEFTGRIVQGYDFVNGDAVPQDDHGHGTHVAGIAAGGLNNGIGIAGLCGQCSVMPLKVLDQYNRGSWSNVAAAITYAADHGAKVINLSLGANGGSQTVYDAIQYAVSQGVLVIAAAGNAGSNSPFYPAAYNGVLAVAATNPDDTRWSLSNYGDYIDVAAPGVTVYSAVWTADGSAQYGFKTGTSMASPHVAGLAGLLFSQDPGRSPAEVESLITGTARDLGDPGWDAYYGNGLADAYAALVAGTAGRAAATGTLQATTYYDTNGNGVQDVGEQTPVTAVPVTVFDAGGQVAATGVTDANGVFRAENLPEGTYTVHADTPQGLVATTVGDTTATVSSGQLATAGFGYLVPTGITLLAFEAHAVSGPRAVIAWSARGEGNFTVYRASSAEGRFTRLDGRPEVLGPDAGAAVQRYKYVDDDVEPGQTYWYAVTEANTGETFGPLSVAVPVQPGQVQRLFMPQFLNNR